MLNIVGKNKYGKAVRGDFTSAPGASDAHLNCCDFI